MQFVENAQASLLHLSDDMLDCVLSHVDALSLARVGLACSAWGATNGLILSQPAFAARHGARRGAPGELSSLEQLAVHEVRASVSCDPRHG